VIVCALVFGVLRWLAGRPDSIVRQNPHDDRPRRQLAQAVLVDRAVGPGDAPAAGHAREAPKVDPQPVQGQRHVSCR
jgi:hypothetical protein